MPPPTAAGGSLTGGRILIVGRERYETGFVRDTMVHPEHGPITLVEMEDRDCTTWFSSEWCRDFNAKAVGCLHGLNPPRPIGPTQGSSRLWSDILAELEAGPAIVKGGGVNKPRPAAVPLVNEGSGSSGSGLCPICRMDNCACGLSVSRSRANRGTGVSGAVKAGPVAEAPRPLEIPPRPTRKPPPPPWKARSPASAKVAAPVKASPAATRPTTCRCLPHHRVPCEECSKAGFSSINPVLAGTTPLVSLSTQGPGSSPQTGWGTRAGPGEVAVTPAQAVSYIHLTLPTTEYV